MSYIIKRKKVECRCGAIWCLNDFINLYEENEIIKINSELLEACKMAKLYIDGEYIGDALDLNYLLVKAINRAEGV